MNHHLDTHTIMEKRHITRPADEKIGVKGRHGTSAYDASPHKVGNVKREGER